MYDMPAVDMDDQRGLSRLQLVQLAILVLIVPVQYFVSQSSSESTRQFYMHKFASGLSDFKASYLSINSWLSWCSLLLGRVNQSSTSDSLVPPEIVKKQNKEGYFASSPEPRSPRPLHIQFRVGQVVRHNKLGYKGVIIGWDEKARAPEKWFKEMHPSDKPEWRNIPNYAVLVDTRDRFVPQLTYIVEENIEVITATQIFHPLIDLYFEDFDGAQYLMRPLLKRTYPYD